MNNEKSSADSDAPKQAKCTCSPFYQYSLPIRLAFLASYDPELETSRHYFESPFEFEVRHFNQRKLFLILLVRETISGFPWVELLKAQIARLGFLSSS